MGAARSLVSTGAARCVVSTGAATSGVQQVRVQLEKSKYECS